MRFGEAGKVYRLMGKSQNLGIKLKDKVKICGVWFGKGAQKMNESKILDGIRESVGRYDKRNLNMYTCIHALL
jgi:hypothetical protein